jgi:hypothetical protein
MIRRSIGGLGLILVLSLFFLTTVANAFGIYGPQPTDETELEKYFYWGSDAEPQHAPNGISISVDPTSVSYQTIKATVTMDANLIVDRDISYFAILANGIYVDFFNPYFDNALTPPRNLEYYTLDINITDSMIGSEIYFQVLGVHVNPPFDPITEEPDGRQFVVAWSAQTANYVFKPLPVIDRTAIGYLAGILEKLTELKESLESKLSDLTKAVEAIYKPSPAAEAALEQSMDNFMEKMPTQQMTDNMQEMQDSMQNSLASLHEPGSKLEFGNEFDPNTGNADVDSMLSRFKLDLTEWATYVAIFRSIMAATLWVSFFHYIFNNLTPRLSI